VKTTAELVVDSPFAPPAIQVTIFGEMGQSSDVQNFAQVAKLLQI
jgi:hypothetical protein